MAKRSAKDNLYKNGVATLSKHMTMTLQRPKTLDENIKHLRSILSVDTIIDDIDQEQAVEFLEAIEGNIASEREEMKDALTDAEDNLKTLEKEKDEEITTLEKEKDEEITTLKNEYDDLMQKTDFDQQFGTIQYRAPGIMDDLIMEALAEAYQRLTPVEIMDRLKVNKLKTA